MYLNYKKNNTSRKRLYQDNKAMAGRTDIKMQRNQNEHAIHYIMYAHVRPYRPRDPCARMKYALSHKFEVLVWSYLPNSPEYTAKNWVLFSFHGNHWSPSINMTFTVTCSSADG